MLWSYSDTGPGGNCTGCGVSLLGSSAVNEVSAEVVRASLSLATVNSESQKKSASRILAENEGPNRGAAHLRIKTNNGKSG
jgi:hypothetical protein